MSEQEGRCVRCGEEVYRRGPEYPWRTYVLTSDPTRCPNVGGADIGPHDVRVVDGLTGGVS